MRKHAQSWATRGVFFAIIVVFAFWGVGTGLFNRIHPVASVDGRQILASQVTKEAERLRRNLQATYGDQAAGLLKTINLRQQALDLIIDRHLLEAEAKRLGLRISNQALKLQIAAQRSFQSNGQFDERLYREVLRDNNLVPAEYESATRSMMLINTLRQVVTRSVTVSNAEARLVYNLENLQLSLAYVELPYAKFEADVHPTPKQIEAYYQAHKNEFREPERIQLLYVFYDPATLARTFNPSDEQRAAFYRTNLKTLFTHPESVRARHILIAVPKGASPAEDLAAKTGAEQILKQLRAGASFKKLARKYSDDEGTRDRGGELGFFTRGELVKHFEDAAFGSKPGTFVIARTRFGYHVIQVEEVRKAHVDTEAEARAAIDQALRRQVGLKLARQAADRDLSSALAGGDLRALARKHHLEAVETPFFAPAEAPDVLARDVDVLRAVFGLKSGEVRALNGTHGPFLVKLLGRKAAYVPDFAQIQPAVRAALARSLAEDEALAAARKLLAQVKSPANFAAVAAAQGLKVHATGSFSRSTRVVPGVGEFVEVTDAAARVPATPAMIGRAMEHRGNAYVFEVVSRRSPDETQWNEAASQFERKLLTDRRMQVWQDFLNTLKARARIIVDTNQLGTGAPA